MAASARTAGQQLSNASLQTVLKNAALKQQQQESAQRGLEGLYGESANAGNAALSATAANVNANTQAENASWDWAKDILDPAMQAAGQAAGGGAFK